jgi:hypothetical protein
LVVVAGRVRTAMLAELLVVTEELEVEVAELPRAVLQD